MSDQPHSDGKSHGGIFRLMVVIAIPVLYVLSWGPALWLFTSGTIQLSYSSPPFGPTPAWRICCWVYKPIGWFWEIPIVGENLGEMLVVYRDWWTC